MAHTFSSRTLLRLVCLFVVGFPLFMSTPQRTFAANLTGTFRGNAYGLDVTTNVGPTANDVRKLGLISCTCQGTSGKTDIVNVKPTTSGDLVKVQGVSNSVTTNRTSTTATVQTRSKVTGLSVLNGTITADAVEAVANANASATMLDTGGAGSVLVNLKIAGRTITANPQANTTVDVPGFGSVILREVVRETVANRQIVNVNMLHIKIAQNNSLNLPIGAEIIIAHATAGFVRSPLNAIVQGNASVASSQTTLPAVQSSLNNVAAISTGCEGTNNQTIKGAIDSINVPRVLVNGVGRTTAFGGVLDGATLAKTTAQVEQVNLLNGLIRADSVAAVSQSSLKNGVYSASTQGTSFVNLRINNQPIASSVAPNTRIELSGVGYVILNQLVVKKTATSAEASVKVIQVYITASNASGLPVGSQIVVGSASTQVLSY